MRIVVGGCASFQENKGLVDVRSGLVLGSRVVAESVFKALCNTTHGFDLVVTVF